MLSKLPNIVNIFLGKLPSVRLSSSEYISISVKLMLNFAIDPSIKEYERFILPSKSWRNKTWYLLFLPCFKPIKWELQKFLNICYGN
jgi:hypothetical protein